MPPLPHWYHGIAAVTDFAVQVPMTRCPSWRYLPTSANGQPAVAFYLGADAAGPHLAWSITVLTLRGDRIAEITSFLGPDYFTAVRAARLAALTETGTYLDNQDNSQVQPEAAKSQRRPKIRSMSGVGE